MEKITQEQYENAIKIVKLFKQQSKVKIRKEKNIDYFKNINEFESAMFTKMIFEGVEYFRYKKLIDRISFCSEKVGKKIGHNLSRLVLKNLIDSDFIIREGDFKFSTYIRNESK